MTSNYIQSNQTITLAAPLAASLTNLIQEADSGKVLILPSQTAIQTFTLPLPISGLCYKIIANGTIGFDVTISTTPGALFYGRLVNVSSAVTVAGTAMTFSAAKIGVTNIIFEAAALKGTWVEMISDGDIWYVIGLGDGPGTTLVTLGLN